MISLPYFEVAAFASRPFAGNPAGVCLLEKWLPDSLMQSIAAENNLAETAFLVPRDRDFELRWFTPAVEMDLCGHATLGAAFVLFSERKLAGDAIRFHSRSGPLTVTRTGDLLELDFPSRPPQPCAAPDGLVRAVGGQPGEILKARDYLLVYGHEAEVRALQPDFAALARLDVHAVIVTAGGGGDCDFVSRFFAPSVGVPEDPVTGSAHCTLIPYWSRRLGKQALFARQVSLRGGELWCRSAGERVSIGGRAVLYGRGEISVPDAG